MNTGVPPTALNARTGELTPPGILVTACAKRISDLLVMGRMFSRIRGRSHKTGCPYISVTIRARCATSMLPVNGLAIFGVSLSRGGVEAITSFQERLGGPQEVMAVGFPEAVVLSTCNRFEVVARLPEGSDCRDARNQLERGAVGQEIGYAFQDEGALEHLCRVAASLESVNPGEDQVMRQVRSAFARARAVRATGPLTTFAFESALRVAKRVRHQVPLAPMNASLFTLAMPLLRDHLSSRPRVAVVGAGEMGRAAATSLARWELEPELVIVNRDAQTGQRLADDIDGAWHPLEGFLAGEVRVDAIVSATPRAGLLDSRVLSRLTGVRAIVDLGVPRNVDPAAAERSGVTVISHAELQVAGLHRRVAIAEKLARADAVLLAELDTVLDAWTDRQLGPAITRLRRLYRETIGDSLPSEEASALAHRFAHVPAKGLRAIARRYGLDAAATFLSTVDDA